jgi:hypothetical protein
MEQTKISPDMTSFEIDIQDLPEEESFDQRARRLQRALRITAVAVEPEAERDDEELLV